MYALTLKRLFSAIAQAHAGVDPCQDVRLLTINKSLPGEILSANYPHPYPVEKNCQWHIQALPGHLILLTVLHFDVNDIG